MALGIKQGSQKGFDEARQKIWEEFAALKARMDAAQQSGDATEITNVSRAAQDLLSRYQGMAQQYSAVLDPSWFVSRYNDFLVPISQAATQWNNMAAQVAQKAATPGASTVGTSAINPNRTYGYTPEEKKGMLNATAAPIAASYNAGMEELKNRANQTGSTVGLAPNLLRFETAKGQALAPALAGLQTDIGNARRSDEQYYYGKAQDVESQQRGIAANQQAQQADIQAQKDLQAGSQFGQQNLAQLQKKLSKPTTSDRLWGAAAGALNVLAPGVGAAVPAA